MKRYVSVDPSGNFTEGKGHTGIATMVGDDWNTLQIVSLSAKDYPDRHSYWNAIIATIVKAVALGSLKNKIVVIESFTIRSNGFLIGKMPETIQLIGALCWELEKLGIQYVFQMPSQAKTRFNDGILDRYVPNFEHRDNERYYYNGKITNDHERDAIKHLLYYKKYKEDK